MNYIIKKASDLSAIEIKTILEYWDVEEWKELGIEAFIEKFRRSEFHLLTYNNKLVCITRLNFDFKIRIGQAVYEIAELVGLVSSEKMQGYGKLLIQNIEANLRNRHIEAIGFCTKEIRPFYQKCNVEIMPDKAKQLREKELNEWMVPADDDIVNISLSLNSVHLFESLSTENPGYCIF